MVWMSPQLTLLALLSVPFLFAVRRYRSALVERMRVVRTKEGRHRLGHPGGGDRHPGRQDLRPRGR